MKKKLFWLLTLVLAAGFAVAAPTTNQIWQLNNQMGPVAHQLQLGTIISEAASGAALARGYVWRGNSSGVAAAYDANDSGKILVGDGTDLASVAVSGDITLSSAGAVAIANGAIINTDVNAAAAIDFSKLAALPSGQILVGSAGNVPTAVAMSGDATLANSGALTIAAGAVEESMMAVPGLDGLNAKRIARATYDVAVDGGTQVAHALGVTLPAKAIITRSWFYTVTQFSDAGAGTVALHCETANNIFNAADITGNVAGTLVEGISDGATANMKPITNACEITATVATADQATGKLVVFVEYVVVE